ncbi:phosphoesterase RecJ domain protein [Methanococcus vannielii SB]|jgi:nanoRNase/pAp phosphatase (c-di-AMP/oligoRNAs hydrolase)|uniref:Phosphoesterase RecJ domain protein n=1 Tax=Methanococcus vannielii (strain ATCC 35089 / DSM 1224 / JCM 13029 / OCM 148 / SB) TaxID=406327 RepID=A6URN2_METVS|nr:DHH family phosphoesterase [Methanococcus vannielii]ABR55154.1 phosphoesterase RecJ domain protein [Methanococcus vannielii SB]
MKKDLEILKDYLKEEDILLLCHHNADPDAVCAAIGLKYLANSFSKKKLKEKNVRISADSVSKLSRAILTELNEDIEIIEYPKLPKTVFLIDTSSLNQITVNKKDFLNSDVILIDHHRKTDLSSLCKVLIVDENSTSTCEIVSDIFREMNIYPPKNIRTALLLGILYDTKHLKLAKESTFNTISWLIKEISFQKILYLLSQESDPSKRIAHLKSCSRMEIIDLGNYVISISNASSHEASCAKTIVSIGADVSFVVAARKKDKEIRVSVRSRKSVSKKVHMGSLMEKVAKKLGGEGGGHEEAAGLNAPWNKEISKEEAVKEVLSICIETLKEELRC